MSIYLDAIGDENIANLLKQLEARITALEAGTINNVEQLDDIALDLGVIQSGEFRTGEGTPDDGFCGVRMAYPAMEYTVSGSAQSFNVVGVNNDVLQFGLDAASGAAIAGAGAVTLDEDGVTIRASTGANANPGGVTNKNSLSFTDSDGTVVESDVIPADYAGGKRIWVRCGYDTYNLCASAEMKAITEVGEITAGVQLWNGGNRFVIQSTSVDPLQFYMEGKIIGTNPPGCRVYRNSTQAIGATTWTPLSWNTEVNDTDNCWSVGTPTKMYAKNEGYYNAGGSVYVNGTNNFVLTVRVNGGYKAMSLYNNNYGSVSSGMMYLNVDDYVEIVIYSFVAGCTASAANATNEYYNNGWMVRIA